MTTNVNNQKNRTNAYKLLIVRMCLLAVVAFVGGYAFLEHANLQVITNQHNEVVRQYSQTIETLSKQNSDINNQLANNNTELTTAGTIQEGAIQQLSSYNVSGQAKEFAAYNDLIAWLKQDNTHEQVYSASFECVDFAFMMSEHAIKDGYWIFPAVDLADGHMQCIAPIGDALYAIEPQTNAVSLWAMKSTN
jgi:nitrate reductase NapE component